MVLHLASLIEKRRYSIVVPFIDSYDQEIIILYALAVFRENELVANSCL